MSTGAPRGDDDELTTPEVRLIDALPEVARPHLRALVGAIHRGDVDAAERIANGVPPDQRDVTAEAFAVLAWSVGTESARPRDWQQIDERRASFRAYWFAAALLIEDGGVLGSVLTRLLGGRDSLGIDAVRTVLVGRPDAFRRAFGRAWDVRLVPQLWLSARVLAREGLIPEPRPLDPLAILRLGWPTLPAAVRADAVVGDLLDRLWTTPGAGQALGHTWPEEDLRRRPPPYELGADRSSHSAESWAGLLVAWGATDPERRPAVIDACLAALGGAAGERPSDLRGWALVHGRLDVHDDEAAARQSSYLALATGGAAPAAAVARTVLRRLLDAGTLDPHGLVDSAPDALLRREKGAVREYLDLLDRAVRSGAVDAASGVGVVAAVLGELPRGVDSHARRLLASWGTADDGAGVQAEAPSGGRGAETGPWTPPAPVDLPAPGRLRDVASVDDLVDLLLLVLDRRGEAIDLERVVDGMMRLREPSPTVGGHLRARGYPGWEGNALADLVHSWLRGEVAVPASSTGLRPRIGSRLRRRRVYRASEVVPGARVTHCPKWIPGYGPVADDHPFSSKAGDSWLCEWEEPCWIPDHLVAARLTELLPLVGGTPVRSLALPTHTDGGVDGARLAERLRERADAGRPAGRRELAAALQRLVPEDRALLRAAGALPDQARSWLDLLAVPSRFGRLVAEPRAYRYEHVFEPGEVQLWQPAAAMADRLRAVDGEPDDPVRWWLDTSTVVDCWGDHTTGESAVDRELATWLLHLPWHPDVAAVHMQPEIMTATEIPETDLASVLQVMSGRRVPLGPQATDLLCWAATYRSAHVRASASEAIATAARHGILDGNELGRSVARLVGPEAGPFLAAESHLGPAAPKLSRIASTLADVARIDEHGEAVALAAVATLLPDLRPMRGGVALLEIGAAIAERRGIRLTLPESLASLAAGRASSRLAEEARRISGVGRTAVPWAPAVAGHA